MNDAELYELSDEELIAYVTRARAAGRADAAKVAVQVLAFKHEKKVTGFMQSQLGSKGREVVDQVVARTLADAIAAAASFEGETIEQFRGFLFRIARRRRIDYLRKNRVDVVPLTWESDGEQIEREIAEGDPLDAVDRASVFNQAFTELKKDAHKLVVMLTKFHDLSAKDVVEQVNRQFGGGSDDPMTEQNVNQINSRFNKRLDELLDD